MGCAQAGCSRAGRTVHYSHTAGGRVCLRRHSRASACEDDARMARQRVIAEAIRRAADDADRHLCQKFRDRALLIESLRPATT